MKDRSFEMVVPSGIENSSSLETLFPFDITINILKRLPVKTLTRFKSVAKDWMKLFESPYFMALHHSHSASNNTFLLQPSSIPPYLLIGPDLKVNSLQFMDFTCDIIASCNGLLLCVDKYKRDVLFLCNPATRQIKQVPETLIEVQIFYDIGFGFSDIANDYKIVRTSTRRYFDDIIGSSVVRFDRAEVYSLTTGLGKKLLSSIYIICVLHMLIQLLQMELFFGKSA